ncbi:MAG TPA: response regulator [Chthoniobacteraceae bacterium]|jgi:CheY-like chemotaxis protein|nr:response regulator [Chthoniobacteraceae bacterium]
MLGSEEIRWVKSTANELNNLLQVISESSQMLERLCEGTSDTDKYFGMLQTAVDRAAKVTRLMVDRVGGYSAEVPDAAPQTEPPESLRTTPPADVKIYNPQGPLELVMIVDDEDFVTMLAQRVLADQGYRVITAKDGFQALDIYKKMHREIALIILDFTMPVMDGADVFNELLQIDPKVAVVLSSGFAEQDRLRGMLARGLRGFIPKPYTQQKLLTQIRTTLDALKNERGAR